MGSSLWHVGSFVAVWGLLSSWGTRAPGHTGPVVVARGLSSCGAQAPECVGSVVVAHGLSCPAACGILVPWPGFDCVSPALESGFLTTGPPGKSWGSFLIMLVVFYMPFSFFVSHFLHYYLFLCLVDSEMFKSLYHFLLCIEYSYFFCGYHGDYI